MKAKTGTDAKKPRVIFACDNSIEHTNSKM